MGDIAAVETAQNVTNRVHFADRAQEFVPQPFAFGRPLNKACNINEFQLSRDDFGRLGDHGQLLQARIRHRNTAHIGFNRAKGEVCRLRRLSLGQGVEQGGFPNIRKPDDTAIKTHDRDAPSENKNSQFFFASPDNQRFIWAARPPCCSDVGSAFTAGGVTTGGSVLTGFFSAAAGLRSIASLDIKSDALPAASRSNRSEIPSNRR